LALAAGGWPSDPVRAHWWAHCRRRQCVPRRHTPPPPYLRRLANQIRHALSEQRRSGTRKRLAPPRLRELAEARHIACVVIESRPRQIDGPRVRMIVSIQWPRRVDCLYCLTQPSKARIQHADAHGQRKPLGLMNFPDRAGHLANHSKRFIQIVPHPRHRGGEETYRSRHIRFGGRRSRGQRRCRTRPVSVRILDIAVTQQLSRDILQREQRRARPCGDASVRTPIPLRSSGCAAAAESIRRCVAIRAGCLR